MTIATATGLLAIGSWLVAAQPGPGVLFSEGFNDARLQERGWYDGARFKIAAQGALAGGGCIEYHWKPGTTSPDSSSGMRHLFEPTDTVYLRFYMSSC